MLVLMHDVSAEESAYKDYLSVVNPVKPAERELLLHP